MSEDPPDPQELADAEALARALEGKPAAAPEDALQVAALLRYARGADVAEPARLARALAAVKKPLNPVRVVAFAVGTGVVSLAAAMWLVYLPRAESPVLAPAAQAARTSSALLEAQARVIADPARPLDELARETAAQRRQLFAQLGERYGGAR